MTPADILNPTDFARQGESHFRQGEYLAAAQSFDLAMEGFAAQGDEAQRAEMANNSSVAYLQAGQADLALERVADTPEVFARLGDARRQGMALGNRAAAHEALGQFEQALADYRQAATLLQQSGDNENYLQVMKAISTLQLRRGKPLEALTTMQSGVNTVQRPGWKERILKSLLNLPSRLIR